jgi:hypothetical protein
MVLLDLVDLFVLDLFGKIVDDAINDRLEEVEAPMAVVKSEFEIPLRPESERDKKNHRRQRYK